jgi:S-DNA-T family DNA segregation ATPase FtsK/SpoIIIE
VAKKAEVLESRVPLREKVKELGGLFFALCAMFVFVSLASYDAGDIAEVKYPPNAPLANKGGAIGAAVSHALLSHFGMAAYLLVGFVGFWSFVVFFRRKMGGLGVKLVAVGISVFAAATLLSMQPVFGAQTVGLGGTAPGAGGAYGKTFEILLVSHLGAMGAWLAVILALCVSLVLSTDWLIYAGVLKIGRGAMLVLGRVRQHYTPEERARRQASEMERAQAELARRMTSVPACPEPGRGAATVVPPPAPRRIEVPAPVRVEPPAARTIDLKPADRAASPDPFKAAVAAFDLKKVAPYEQPPIELFDSKVEEIHGISDREIKDRMAALESALDEYGIEGRVVHFEVGPAVTTYEVELASGQQIHAITARQDEITMRLATLPVRVVAPLPGKGTVGVEVPNPYPMTVRIRGFLDRGYADLRKIPLPMILGKTNGGDEILRSLTDLPHLLIAGTTGSGKSVCLKSIITSLVVSMSWEEMKLILIDPKQVELTAFSEIPHLWAPVVVDSKKAGLVLDWLVKEMDERYTILNRVGVTSIDRFNKLGEKKLLDRLAEAAIPEEEAALFPVHLPYIVAIIDELADLMLTGRKEVEHSIVRLSQKARAIGIHLIVATQRPSTDVITGLIKSNMPSRISFRVPSQVESRIIIDAKGAERLLGKGDMLVKMIDKFEPSRGQCTFVAEEEIRGLVAWLRSRGKPEYHQELIELKTVAEAEGSADDELFDEAVRIVLQEQRGSTSLIQRHLSIGYSRAARLIDAMAKSGIVGPYNGSSARDVLITPEQWEAQRRPEAV